MAAGKPISKSANSVYTLLSNLLGTAAGPELGALVSQPSNYWMIAALLGTCGAQTLFQRWSGAKDSAEARKEMTAEIDDLLAKFQKIDTGNQVKMRGELLAAIQQHSGESVDPARIDQLIALVQSLTQSVAKQNQAIANNGSLLEDVATKIEAIDPLALKRVDDQVDHLRHVTEATNATVDDNRRALAEANRKLDQHGVKDATIERLLKELDAKEARINELESAQSESPETVVREAVASVVDEGIDLDSLTGDKLQTALVAKSDRLEKEEAAKTEELIETNRRILHFAQLRSDVREVERRIERILARRPNDLDALNSRGHLRMLKGELAGAETDYQRVAELADGDRSVEAVAYGNLGIIYRTRGELDRAEEMHLKSLEIEKQLGRREGMASDYGNLGLIYQTRGELDRAEEMLLKSLEISEQIGRREEMAGAYGNLGLIYQTRGELDRAEEKHLKSLEISEQLGRREGMAGAYGNLGIIYQIRGELDRAEEKHLKSLEISEQLGRREGMACQYGNLGLIYKTRGELDRAEEMLLKSLEINEQLGRREGMASDYGNLGTLRKQQGRLEDARELWTRSRDLFEEIGIPHMVEQLQSWIDDLPANK